MTMSELTTNLFHFRLAEKGVKVLIELLSNPRVGVIVLTGGIVLGLIVYH